MPPLTKVTKILIITCVVAYFLDVIATAVGLKVNGLFLSEIFGLVPARVADDFWGWQFFTYMFMHGTPLHLLLNMLILWFFGSEIELKMGSKAFLLYFFLCGVGAGIFNVAVNAAFSDVSTLHNPIIGASGAIFGLLAAYGLFFGERYMLVLLIFPMKAKYFVLVMAALELMMGVQSGVQGSAQDNVAHFAHLGGMVIGAIYIYFKYLRPGGGGRMSRKDYEKERLRKQFTLIVNDSMGKSESNDDKGPYWN